MSKTDNKGKMIGKMRKVLVYLVKEQPGPAYLDLFT
jgi:hypothetical protein